MNSEEKLMCTQLISFIPILKYMFFFAMEHQRLVQKKTFVKDIYKFYHDLHFKMIG